MRDIKGANGFIVARVDSSGNVTLGADAGPITGRAANSGEIFDDEAGVHQVGRVDGDGNVYNMRYEVLGKVDAWGHVYDRGGCLIGKVEKPVDAGVLMFLAEPTAAAADATASAEDEPKLMDEALDLAEEHRFPTVRKDYKPLTERDLFMEHLRRDSS
jgi:hypothetical protein